MDFSTVCRMCLSTENLTPIFENSFDQIDYSTTVYIITGIKVCIEGNRNKIFYF